MPRKKQYYDIKNMLATDAEYMMLLGERSNGKSYQAKKTIIESALNGKRFVYLRRWQEDIRVKSITQYFADMPIHDMTHGEWERIEAFNGDIFFTRTEGEKRIKSESIGNYCALNLYERYKSLVFKDIEYMIYEEFITDKLYLTDEPRLLQQFVSTVARDNRIHVLLVGNTLSRVCPYFSEWCLDGVLKQKQGTIEVYHFHVEDSVINIAVEYCANTKTENKMFFGQSAKQIISGEWDTKDVPKLPRKQYEYEKVYEVLVEYQKFKFVIELLIEPKSGGKLCFVYPFTGNRKNIYRIITDTFSDLPNVSNRLDTSKKAEMHIYDCFRLGKVCYSDNLTGADFNNVRKVFGMI